MSAHQSDLSYLQLQALEPQQQVQDLDAETPPLPYNENQYWEFPFQHEAQTIYATPDDSMASFEAACNAALKQMLLMEQGRRIHAKQREYIEKLEEGRRTQLRQREYIKQLEHERKQLFQFYQNYNGLCMENQVQKEQIKQQNELLYKLGESLRGVRSQEEH